jgi:Ca2+-binding RTX toxin-like protein
MYDYVFHTQINMLTFDPTQFTGGTVSWKSSTEIDVADTNGDTAVITGTGFITDLPFGTVTGAVFKTGGVVTLSASNLAISVSALYSDRSNAAALEGLLFGGTVSITGLAAGDVLVSGPGTSYLYGKGAHDTLYGNGQLNYLDGSGGYDALVGTENGYSIADYADAKAAVTVNLLDPAKNKGDAVGDTYSGIQGVIGTATFNDVIVANDYGDTIKDGNGNDTVTGGAGGDTITLGNGADVVHGGAGNNNVITVGNGVDTVICGAGTNAVVVGKGNDTIVLGNGTDTVTPGGGADKIEGGTGSDTFVYHATSDSTPSAPDKISGWHHGDKINLSAIDANTTIAGVQHFTIGTNDKIAGTIVITHNVGLNETLVSLYTNTSGVATGEIILNGDKTLTAADFVLSSTAKQGGAASASPSAATSLERVSAFSSAMAGFAGGAAGEAVRSGLLGAAGHQPLMATPRLIQAA